MRIIIFTALMLVATTFLLAQKPKIVEIEKIVPQFVEKKVYVDRPVYFKKIWLTRKENIEYACTGYIGNQATWYCIRVSPIKCERMRNGKLSCR